MLTVIPVVKVGRSGGRFAVDRGVEDASGGTVRCVVCTLVESLQSPVSHVQLRVKNQRVRGMCPGGRQVVVQAVDRLKVFV